MDHVLVKLFRKRFDEVGFGVCWSPQADCAIGMLELKLRSPSIDLGRATTDRFRGAACVLLCVGQGRTQGVCKVPAKLQRFDLGPSVTPARYKMRRERRVRESYNRPIAGICWWRRRRRRRSQMQRRSCVCLPELVTELLRASALFACSDAVLAALAGARC